MIFGKSSVKYDWMSINISKEDLQKNENLSLRDLASKYYCSQECIRQKLIKFGINKKRKEVFARKYKTIQSIHAKTKYLGVYLYNNKYFTAIYLKRKWRIIGEFSDIIQAAKFYNVEINKLFPNKVSIVNAV